MIVYVTRVERLKREELMVFQNGPACLVSTFSHHIFAGLAPSHCSRIRHHHQTYRTFAIRFSHKGSHTTRHSSLRGLSGRAATQATAVHHAFPSARRHNLRHSDSTASETSRLLEATHPVQPCSSSSDTGSSQRNRSSRPHPHRASTRQCGLRKMGMVWRLDAWLAVRKGR